MIKRLYSFMAFKVYHFPTKFGEHKHCGSGDMFLICCVNSHDQIIKGLYGLMDGSPSR